MKTNRPRAQSSYQIMGEAPWGHIWKTWPEVVAATQPPEMNLWHGWMENLMPKNMVIVSPDRVLVVGTVEDYVMTVEYKVWENQLASRGYNPTSWLVYDEDYGSPTRGTRLAMLCIRRGFPDARTPLHLCLLAVERIPPWSASIHSPTVHSSSRIRSGTKMTFLAPMLLL
jgi:hypothetical protein